MTLIGITGINGLGETNQQLKRMFNEKLIPSNVANRMMALLADNRSADHARTATRPANPNSNSMTTLVASISRQR